MSISTSFVRTGALVALLLPSFAVSGCAQQRPASPPEPMSSARTPRPPRAPQPPDGARAVTIYRSGQRMPFAFPSTARTYLGVSLIDVSSPDDTLGILIDSVEDDQPAAKAGIAGGSRLVSLDGVDLRLDPADLGDSAAEAVPGSRLRRVLSRKSPGDTVTAVVLANGQRSTKRVVLDASPLARSMSAITAGRRVLGVSFSERGAERDTAGLLIINISNGGAADRAGLVEGDRVVRIDNVDLRVPRSDAGDGDATEARVARLRRHLDSLRDSQSVTLEVLSEGRVRTVTLVPTRERGITINGTSLNGFTTGLRSALAPLREMRLDIDDDMDDMRVRSDDRERLRDEAREVRELAREQASRAREEAREQASLTRDEARAQRERAGVTVRSFGRDDDDDDDSPLRGTISGTSDGATLSISGLTVAAIDADFAQQLGAGSERGALVVRSQARWAPLRAGDVVLSVEGRPVRTGDQLNLTFDRSRNQRVEILRNRRRETVTVPPSR